MKNTVLLFVLFATQVSYSQMSCGFESINLPSESFNNNSATGEFVCENVSIFNSYDEDYMFWSGWAISNITDNTVGGLGNQYASRAGSGDDSENYAITYAFSGSIVRFDERSEVQSVSISNSAYAYYSMIEGDAFAKKFGGESGNDPDFFELKIRKYLDGVLGTEEIVLMLADYTSSDNTQDYILEDWNLIDCQNLGLADSLLFTLSSSDNGDFGMNTPAYFCLDNVISIPETLGLLDIEKKGLNIFPNPIKDSFTIENFEPSQLYIYDLNGKEVFSQNLQYGLNLISDFNLISGSYICIVQSENSVKSELLVIH